MLDGGKLFKILTNNPELKEIPIVYVMKVAICVMEAINNGSCLNKLEEEYYV